MRFNILAVIFIVFMCHVSMAQTMKRFGSLKKENDSFYIIENGKSYVANEKIVTVKLKPGIELENGLQKVRSNKLGYIDLLIPNGVDIGDYVSKLERTGKYSLVEYNSRGSYNGLTNDTYRGSQWYLSSINAFSAWNITMGNPNITVAVLDSGTDWTHPDLGYGTDGYTKVNEELAWNYVSNTNNVITSNRHGTIVTGVLGAKSNNSRGISGVSGGNNAAGISVVPFCVGVQGVDSYIVDDAIIDAVDLGARVIQLSFSISQTNAINAAINYAVQNNVVIICSSGNDYFSSVSYPASNQNVIGVGATNINNMKADFSNYGTSLDIVAPGVDILSTTLNNGYVSDSGTSFASPIVSGVAALVLSVNPFLTGQEVRDILEQTAQKVGGYSYDNTSGRINGTWHSNMGYGLVDAYAAVNIAVTSKHAISGPTTLCTQGVYSIDNLPIGATVTWQVGSGLSVSTSQNTATVMATGSGISSWIKAQVTVGSKIFDLPQKNIWVGSTTSSITGPQHVPNGGNEYYYAIPSGDSDNVSYQWSITPSIPFTASGSSMSVSFPYTNADYTIKLTTTNSCGSTVKYHYVATGAYEPDRVYPNPSSDMVHVNLNGTVGEISTPLPRDCIAWST